MLKVQPKTRGLAKSAGTKVRLHVILGQRKTATSTAGLKPTVARVAKEVNGKVVSYREMLAK